MKSKELKEFIDENCPKCQEQCNYGIREMPTFIRCMDRNIYKEKENIDFREENNV